MISNFNVSSSPHIRSEETTQSIMKHVVISLLPATAFSVYNFGMRAFLIIAITILTCVGAEYIWQKTTKQPITINDFSAVLTGLLLAFNLPPTVPFWLPVVGGAFAIIIVKQFFGGLGQNFLNPALGARAFLLTAWTGRMTDFAIDGVSSATPLDMIKQGQGGLPALQNVLVGNIAGCIGETSALLLLLGGLYLIYKKIIEVKIPLSFIGTVVVLTYIFGGNGIYEALSGGLILGAFYMATDYSSSPITSKGKWIMGFGCGFLTAIIRKFGGYPEGVSYAILIMNLFVPLIDRYTKPRIFGEVVKNG